MEKENRNPINVRSILEMNNGAFMERADYEVSRILNNILDANTRPTEKRTLNMKVTFTPDDDRTGINVEVVVTSKLAATTPSKTSLYVAGSNDTGEVTVVEMVPQVPGQQNIFGTEQARPATLKIVKCS